MITIRVSEARNKLSALLDRVERGETVVITRRGVPVARLVPDASAIETRQAQDAMMRMRARVSEIRLGPFDWDDLNEIETQADHKDRLDSREEYYLLTLLIPTVYGFPA